MIDSREIRAAGVGAALVCGYMAFVLMSGRIGLADFGHLFAAYLRGSFSLWLLVMACGFAWLVYSGRPRSPAAIIIDWIKARWARDYLVSLLWPPLLFAALMSSFNAFKQMILPIAGFRFDPLFAAADRLLFLGEDPWRITHALFGSPAATSVIDTAYHGWFVPMSLGLMVCAWLPASTYKLRTQYLLSYITMWIGVGSILAFLLPAAGPCFYADVVNGGQDFAPLMEELAADQAAAAPLSALAFQADLLRMHGGNVLTVGGGISAMPSVHNGLAALFAFAAFRVSRKAGWAMAGYAALIWIGSIHLGWHYAIDGIVSIALAWGIWTVSGRIADLLARPRRQPHAIPAAI